MFVTEVAVAVVVADAVGFVHSGAGCGTGGPDADTTTAEFMGADAPKSTAADAGASEVAVADACTATVATPAESGPQNKAAAFGAAFCSPPVFEQKAYEQSQQPRKKKPLKSNYELEIKSVWCRTACSCCTWCWCRAPE